MRPTLHSQTKPKILGRPLLERLLDELGAGIGVAAGVVVGVVACVIGVRPQFYQTRISRRRAEG